MQENTLLASIVSHHLLLVEVRRCHSALGSFEKISKNIVLFEAAAAPAAAAREGQQKGG